jgi:ubiquinone/menaquinone biosynthesis C-methylase UbiE
MNVEWPRETYTKKPELWSKLFELFSKTEDQINLLSGIFSAYGVGRKSRILDLCCGSGRHAIALAKKGYRVVGIDLSEPLIKMARNNAKNREIDGKVEFIVGDVRDLDKIFKGYSFGAVISMTYSIGYYTEEADENILGQARKLTSRSGILVIDLDINRDYFVSRFTRTAVFAVGKHEIHEYRKFDFERSRYQPTWKIFEETGKDLRYEDEFHLDMRLYSLHELISLVERAGWEYNKAYGDFSLRPVTKESSRITLVARNSKGIEKRAHWR